MSLCLVCRCCWLVVVVLAVDVEEACFDFVVVDAASGVDEAESLGFLLGFGVRFRV